MKRIMAMLLSLLLVLGALPGSAFAALAAAPETEGATETESALLEEERFTQESLFEGYVESVFYPNSDTYSVGNQTAGAKLTGVESSVYYALIPFIKQIARGERINSIITVGKGNDTYPSDDPIPLSGKFADFDRRQVVLALRSDFPYEMYWFDYYTGFSVSYSYNSVSEEITRLTFKFTVAAPFRGSDKFVADRNKTAATVKAANNARAIADSLAGKSQYKQLLGFKDKICQLVEYDYDYPSSSAIHNGPWQLIHVFDNDPATNVVCAGYTKAFQYLCDLNNLTCYSVSGYTSGNHAWNIVTLDGQNYLVDVTNCDSGMWGQDGSLFLAGAKGSPSSKYTVSHRNYTGSTISYTYDDSMIPLWGNDVLTLASRHYVTCDHTFSSVITKAAQCEASGVMTNTCSRCGYSETEDIPMLGHDPVSVSGVAPSCTEPGFSDYSYCSRCSVHLTTRQEIAATGHTPVTDPAVEATCKAPGKTEGSHCSVCSAVIKAQKTIPAKAHTPVTDPAVEATCTEPGKTEGSHCSVCGTVLKAQTETTPALGHDPQAHDGKAPGCFTIGYTPGIKCSRCGLAIEGTEFIFPLGHDIVTDPGTGATCETPGLTEGTHCSRCGEVIKSQKEIPALGHNPVVDKGTPATCTSAGLSEGTHCSRCGKVTKAREEIPALGHNPVVDKGTPATCTSAGLTEGSHCSRCNITIAAQEIIPAAHSYDHGFDYDCNVCGATREVDMTRPMVDMFRMYNPNTGEHFYTGSTEERDNLIGYGWQYEGVGFTFPLTTGDPVYRLFQPSTGEHLYTMDKTEKALLESQGWNYEGIAFNSGFKNEVPQYRLHNPNATVGAYHFTASLDEMNTLTTAGWEYQGIGWYSLGAMP